MPPESPSSDAWAPPSFSPFASFTDAETLKGRACTVLREHLGEEGQEVSVAFAHGSIAVQGDHTHYSAGFALLRSIEPGVAVAVAPADGRSLVLCTGDEGRQVFTQGEADREGAPEWAAVTHALRHVVCSQPVHVAIAGTVPAVCRDSYWAALAVALIRALDVLDSGALSAVEHVGDLRDELFPAVTQAIAEATHRPYSIAYPITAFAGQPPTFLLLDTATREHLPVETEAHSALEWALVDTGARPPRPAAFHRARRRDAEAALEALRAGFFDDLPAFRDLEHRDLGRAQAEVDDDLTPVVQHLVTENRRVQKFVASLRREDWQMIGALLLMSHDSRRTQWGDTSAPVDFVVETAEGLTIDGLYGACMTERDGAVLVTGRPPSFEDGLRRLNDAFAEAFGRSLDILPL